MLFKIYLKKDMKLQDLKMNMKLWIVLKEIFKIKKEDIY